MLFEADYFKCFRYSQRKHLIKQHVMEVLKWGSRVSKVNLIDGRGKTALDVGCAYGYAIEALRSLGYNVIGVDVSKHCVTQARKVSPDFAVCDAHAIPFKNRAFDLVTCFEVLEHLANPIQAIKSAFESCRNVMICTTPNRAVEKPLKAIVRDFDSTHVSSKTAWEWAKCLRGSLNCSLIKVSTFFDANLRVKDKLLFFKSFTIPRLGLSVRILVKR